MAMPARPIRRAPRVVSRSWGFFNLALFPETFAEARLIQLLRDGRDQVDSRVRWFGAKLECAAHDWQQAVHESLDFAERFAA